SSTPRRITKKSILDQLSPLDRGRLKSFINEARLSHAHTILESLIESQIEFQKRLFPIVVRRYQKSRYSRLTHGLLKKFHSAYGNCSKEIEMWLTDQLMKIHLENVGDES